jgi:hypothetical protein
MSFKLLSRQAFSKEGGFSLMGSGRKRAVQYLRDRDDFIKHLFGAIHIPSGMPARSEELRMIRWADTTAVSRNIFVHQGRLILIFSYNKATTVANKSFYIVQRLLSSTAATYSCTFNKSAPIHVARFGEGLL